MALFNRFFGSQSSQSSVSRKKYPLSSPGEDPSVWRQYYEVVPDPCDVRVVVFRQCEQEEISSEFPWRGSLSVAPVLRGRPRPL